MSSILYITYIIFLAIFVSAAVIALLALIKKVTIKPQYEKPLFKTLIIGVVGVVINFVTLNLLSTDQSPLLSDHLLLGSQWDWSFPESSWKSDINFEKVNDSLGMKAVTNCWKNGHKVPVIEWQSLENIKTPKMGKEMEFKVKMRWLAGVLEFDSTMKYEIDKWREGRIKLCSDVALRGSFKPEGSSSWGMLINRAWQ